MSLEQTKLEVEIRGKFMTMACDVEYSLLRIIAYSAPDPQNQLRKFKKMMMHEKIECTLKDLKTYKSHLYIEYESHLNKLMDFKEMRNHFAHHTIQFHNAPDLTTFKMIYVDEIAGVETFASKEYTLNTIKQKTQEFIFMNREMITLSVKLFNEHNSKTGEQKILDLPDWNK